MKHKYFIINHNKSTYKKAKKKEKTQMLDELSRILHMNRHYIAYLLRNSGKVILRKGNLLVVADPTTENLSKRGRKKMYGDDVVGLLKKLWRISGFVSSKHLVGFIRLNNEILFEHPSIKPLLSSKTKEDLLRISASTVDRLLKPYRDRVKISRTGTYQEYCVSL